MKNNKSSLVWGFVVSLSIACSPSVLAFAHDKLKGLADQIQKNLPAPEKNDNGAQFSDAPAMKNFQGESSTKSGNSGITTLGYCDSEGYGFNTSSAKKFNVGDPQALVQQYFNLDPTIATIQLKSYLFENRNEVIGTSFPEAILDGGIFSGEARALGIQLLKDPSISSLAQIIAAAGQKKKGFSMPDIQVYESKAIAALVALQLEPLLKQPSVIESLLKESRATGRFGGAEIQSSFAHALSARFELIRKNNERGFNTFLGFSLDVQAAGLEGKRFIDTGCQMCERTRKWAVAEGISDWAQRQKDGERIVASLNEGKLLFNSVAWSRAYDQTVAERDRLDTLVLSSFEQAKTQSRTTSAGQEQARKSAELSARYGMEENPEVTRAGRILALDTPTFADAEKKAALEQALRDRWKLVDQVRRLQAPLLEASMSGNYSITDIGRKGIAVMNLENSVCLVAFAKEKAASASEASLPDPADNQAEEDFMRQ